MSKHLAVWILLILLTLSSCSSPTEEGVTLTTPEGYGATDLPGSPLPNIENETDYSNITATTEYDTYDPNVERIRIKVTDNNPGKGFHVYNDPVLQKKEGDKWITIGSSYPGVPGWIFVAQENRADEPNSTYIVYLTKYSDRELTAGDYRLVVFLIDRMLYADFVIESA